MQLPGANKLTTLFISGVLLLASNQYIKAQQQKAIHTDIEMLKRSVASLMQLSVAEVIAQVPVASGKFYIGCPNCNGGAQEMNVLDWRPGMGETVQCRFCKMLFPNEKFPNNQEKVIIAPNGAKQIYRYYRSAEGREYYYEAHAWYERWQWIQKQAEHLGKLWILTRDNAYGDRAAAITGRFAQVFPDYAVRFDYPNRQIKFFPANQKWPYQGLVPYRGAKWSWWAYGDIPVELAEVYRQLQEGYDWKRMDAYIGKETDKRIARDLLKLSYEFTAANTESYTNMSPGMYRDMIKAGIILKDAEMVHDGVKRFREFVQLVFFADGWWKEGSTSYHDQTIGGLESVVMAAKGYTDPPDWKGERFNNLDLRATIPFYQKAVKVSEEAILPNGRKTPINDTWANRGRKEKPTQKTLSRLWPSLGNASLGTGEGNNQIMLNINWSGNYGHSHYDNASIILYAAGTEMLSDIGYTHSKYRGWTIHTASHNTVVIDQKGQDTGTPAKPATGRLQFYDDQNEHVKAIDVDASPAYAIAETYRRRLVMVHAAPGRDYVVDRFDVKGGKEHDWFLHGLCEEEGLLETSIPLNQKIESLVPDWGGKNTPKTQYDTDDKKFHVYGYLKDIKTGNGDKTWLATWKYKNSGLRTHNLSQAGTQVFQFRSPSIRLANEDDNKLDSFMRNGIMQRHTGGNSAFISIHEPFHTEPWIESVRNDGKEIIVSYTLNGKLVEDRINFGQDDIQVKSSAGWNYKSGKPFKGKVLALDNTNEKFRLKLDQKVPEANFIRLDLNGEEMRYYPLINTDGSWVELDGDPGFTISADKVVFHSFPHDEYKGSLGYTIFKKRR